MSIRNLDKLFHPRSVAVVGASDRPGSIGSLLMRNLREGGFQGPVWPVNPHRAAVAGLPAWPEVAALPEAPDLALICTPARTVPGLIEQLGRKGTRAAIVISAGLREPLGDGSARSIEQAMLDAARPHLLRILGPNCVGLLVPGAHLNASFAHASAAPGPLAFISQSGALTTALLDWARERGIGFSHYISLGEGADVDVADLLDYLGSDPGTRAILMYLESVRGSRKFMSAARAAARNKPVLVVKAGRAPAGAKAASSHTGALAGADIVVDAAIRRAGMLRVDTLDQLFDAAETLARARPLHGERLAIVTNGGGAGVLAADALSLGGGVLAELSPGTLEALDAALPATWSRSNPVDLIGDAPVERYTAALQVLMQAPEVDAVLFMHAPTAVVPSAEIARACQPLLARPGTRTVLTNWLGGPAVAQARALSTQAGLPGYDTPERAVAAFMQLVEYRRNQDSLLETPPSRPAALAPDLAAARQVIDEVLASGRQWLDEPESKRLLAAYGLPVADTRVAQDVSAAVAAANAIGYPVVIKILSPQISHKSDVGGVALDLDGPDTVREAATQMLARVRRLRPDAQVSGFTVQAMVRRPRAHELIVGLSTDPVFGPTLLFGQGGTAVEVMGDRAVALPPLNVALARQLIARTRVSRLLAGYRDRAAVDHDALHDALLKVSQMACDLPQVEELDINPLLADERGVIALDARVKVRRTDAAPGAHLAIRPYPVELESHARIADLDVLLRPIRPEDEPLLREFYTGADPEDMRLRFFTSRREVPHSELARYSQIDYDRDMTFIALATPADAPGPLLLGEVRAVCDPDNHAAEFAIQTRSGWQGRGVGQLLLGRMIAYLRDRGTAVMVGECLPGNEGMQKLAMRMGLQVTRCSSPQASCLLRLDLQGEPPAAA